MVSILVLTVALFSTIKAQTSEENMKTFFDSELPGLKIQVNATAETQPNQNVTVILSLQAKSDVDLIDVKRFNLSIFGLTNGKDKVLMKNITEGNFALNNNSTMYNFNFTMFENVWDATYGEIILTYSAKYGPVTLDYDNIPCGFTMTYVENVYLKGLEEQLQSLNSTFWQCFGENLTQEDLETINRTYWALQGNQNDLDNTRRVVAGLAVTTVFFVATTVFMFLRKPKQTW